MCESVCSDGLDNQRVIETKVKQQHNLCRRRDDNYVAAARTASVFDPPPLPTRASSTKLSGGAKFPEMVCM